jgi:hypothetical protein
MAPQNRIDIDQIRFDKYPRDEITVDRTTHPIAIRPCPIGALLPIPECQRNLVDYEICAPRRKKEEPQSAAEPLARSSQLRHVPQRAPIVAQLAGSKTVTSERIGLCSDVNHSPGGGQLNTGRYNTLSRKSSTITIHFSWFVSRLLCCGDAPGLVMKIVPFSENNTDWMRTVEKPGSTI